MPVTLTGAASAIASRAAPTISAPASADFPSDASNNQPDQALLDIVASLLAHAGLLDLANAFTGNNSHAGIETFNGFATFNGALNATNTTTLQGVTTIAAPVLHYVNNSGGAAPAFQGHWANVTGQRKLCYWTDPQGTVFFEGSVQRTTANDTLLFTLPAGYRPNAGTVAGVFVDSIGTVTQVYVSSNGDVNLYQSATGTISGYVKGSFIPFVTTA